MGKKIRVLVGSYGCGKTELSLNLAVAAARRGEKTALVDLDIVNPFFRSGFHGEMLKKEQVHLITSEYTLDASDVPVVSPKVHAAFDGDYDTVIFDVGGDPVGATALGQYRQKFLRIPPDDLEILFIVNTRRPLTQTAEDIEEMIDKVQGCSRLTVTALVNNANLAGETSADLLLEGQKILKRVSDNLKIPIGYYGVKERIFLDSQEMLNRFCEGEPIRIQIYTRLEWLDYKPHLH